jgi:hypothetical protein
MTTLHSRAKSMVAVSQHAYGHWAVRLLDTCLAVKGDAESLDDG